MAERKTSEDQDSSFSDREFYTIPGRSRWFLWDEIHETEKRELGEFFDGSSFSRNARVYKEYRDFIINKYREDVSRKLTFTEVRKSLVGDVGSINKVFLFLDRWGLINFSNSNGGSDIVEEFPVLVEDAPPSTVRVVSNPNLSSGSSIPAVFGSKIVDSGSSFRFPPLTSYKDVFRDQILLEGRVCGDCGKECFSAYYESKSGITICDKCFLNVRSGQRELIEDYKFHDRKFDGQVVSSNQWNDRETLSLLEAMVSKGPDWDLVANHVRRSRLDCIQKLVQLPFGDLMGSKHGKSDQMTPLVQEVGESMKENVPDNSAPQKRKFFLCLGDAWDSLLEQVASLSTIVGTNVASAAADVAISELCEESSFAKKVFKSGDDEIKNSPTSDSKVEDKSNFEENDDDTWRNFGRSIFQIRAAATTNLAVAAARAKLLADQEERQMEFLVAYIIDLQIKKMEHKMKHFGELESIMDQEYEEIQQLKKDMIQEWIDVSQQALSAGIPRWKDQGLAKTSSLIN